MGSVVWTRARLIVVGVLTLAAVTACDQESAPVGDDPPTEAPPQFERSAETETSDTSDTLRSDTDVSDSGSAAVIAGAIVVIGLLSLWVDVHFLKEARRFVTIASRPSAPRGHSACGRSQ